MEVTSKLIKWKCQDKIIDTFTMCADEKDIDGRIKLAIIDALNNTPNRVLQINWSKFGKDGDCIVVEDI